MRVKAPHRGLTSGGVTQAVAAAAGRAGLGVICAHRLRHSAATAILAEGGSLAEVGQVLRRRRPHTTAAYTKVNVEALRALYARPWPGVLVVTGLREALRRLPGPAARGHRVRAGSAERRSFLDQFVAYLEAARKRGRDSPWPTRWPGRHCRPTPARAGCGCG